LLVVASIKRTLSFFAWAAALFSLILHLLVWTGVLSSETVLLHTRLVGPIEVGEITASVLPMFLAALLLGWFSRLLRARAYAGSQAESGSSREAQGPRRR
jgi:hypothetical protein